MTKYTRKINEKRVMQGQTYSIHTKKHTGHKGLVVKKNRNGILEVEIFTHSKYTGGRKNIELEENPQLDDPQKSHALPKIQRVPIEKAGKHQRGVVIRNKNDKSVRRNLRKRAKNKKRCG